jgi:hypothetical protein
MNINLLIYATVGLALAAIVPLRGLELWGSAVALLLCAAIVLYGRRRS